MVLATEGQRGKRPSEAMVEERAGIRLEVQPPNEENLGIFAEVLVEQAEDVGMTMTEQAPLIEERGERPHLAETESATRAPSGDAPAEVASGSGDAPASAGDMPTGLPEPQVISGDAPAILVVSDEPCCCYRPKCERARGRASRSGGH